MQAFGLKPSEADHSILYCHTSPAKCINLMVCVDDIVITQIDTIRISQLEEYLLNHLQTRDLDFLKYFLSVKVGSIRGRCCYFTKKICS